MLRVKRFKLFHLPSQPTISSHISSTISYLINHLISHLPSHLKIRGIGQSENVIGEDEDEEDDDEMRLVDEMKYKLASVRTIKEIKIINKMMIK